jgi:putative transposase
MTSEDVSNHLAELLTIYGVPEHIRSDNGPKFIAKAIQRWLASLSVKTLCFELCSAWQNGYAESFHSRLRDELLNMEVFESVAYARAHDNTYHEDYNRYRPPISLGGIPPNEFALRCVPSAP